MAVVHYIASFIGTGAGSYRIIEGQVERSNNKAVILDIASLLRTEQ